MTAATPMIMPSIVRAVRILLRFKAFSAIRSVISRDIFLLSSTGSNCFGRRRKRRELVLRVSAPRDGAISDDLSVTESHGARAVLRDVHFVRDEDHRDSALLIEPLEDAHHFDARLGVEVPG